MDIVIVALVVVAAVALGIVALGMLVRWVQSDGGPRRCPMPAPGSDWSPDLPTRPYSST